MSDPLSPSISVPGIAPDTTFPLSPAQRRLWFVHEWDPEAVLYNYPLHVRIRGGLDLAALERALCRVVDRHTVLRSRFEEREGAPVQVVSTNCFSLAEEDLRGQPGVDQERAVHNWLAVDAETPFDLGVSPVRGRVLTLADDHHILLLTFHHIVFDGWSSGLLADELAHWYAVELPAPTRAEDEPPALALQYGQLARRQLDAVGEERGRKSARFWLDLLTPAAPELTMPTEHPRPESLSGATGRVWIEVDPLLSAGFTAMARSLKATPYMAFMGIFQLLLSRYSGQTDFCVGAAVAGRRDPDAPPLIGLFVNQLTFRANCRPEESFADLVTRVRRQALAIYRHDDLPFEQVVGLVQPARDTSRHPLFQFALVMQPESDEEAALRLPGLAVEDLEMVPEASALDVTVNIVMDADHIHVAVDFSRDLWTQQWAEEFGRRFLVVIASVIADPHQLLDDIDLSGEQRPKSQAQERRPAAHEDVLEILRTAERPVWAEIGSRATEIADHTAVEVGAERTSREQLWRRAVGFSELLTEAGVGPGDAVAVTLGRSVDLIALVIGIWRRGAVFVPLDPEYPDMRLQFVLADCRAGVLVGERAQAERLERISGGAMSILHPDQCVDTAGDLPSRHLAAEDWSAQPAYVIYTSGSTGRPKGVVVTQGALAHYVRVAGDLYRGAAGTSLWHAPLGFDATITSVWVPLARGGSVQVVPGGDALAAVQNLQDLLASGGRADLLKITPAHLELLRGRATQGAQIGTLVVGGEALHGNQIRPWMTCADQIVNEYGPTETTVGVIVAELDPGTTVPDRVPIGRPLPGTHIRLVDHAGRRVEPGIVGEICIGGLQLAAGYLGQPQLTEERFRPGPAGERYYHTGDLGWIDPTGVLQYAGRSDDQVKLNGHRVELGEVESALAAHPSVSLAAATLTDGQLVGYVVPDRGSDPGPDAAGAVGEWRTVFDESFEGSSPEPEFDLRGWTSSVDGSELGAHDMALWRDQTIALLAERPARRVLEIGCGTGLIALPMLELCDEYVGADFSEAPLEGLREVLARRAPGRTRLIVAAADDLTDAGRDFDLIAINSVAQYFPDWQYAWQVLGDAYERLRPGGRLVIGDVRHAGLNRLFYAEILAARHRVTSGEQLGIHANRAAEDDIELTFDPRFFLAFGRALGLSAGQVSIRPKRGGYRNELSLYRYDVVISTGDLTCSPADRGTHNVDWSAEDLDLHRFDALLAEGAESLRVCSIPNRRLDDALRLVDEYSGRGEAVDPEEILTRCEAHGYRGQLSWARAMADGAFDVSLTRGGWRHAAGARGGDPGPAGGVCQQSRAGSRGPGDPDTGSPSRGVQAASTHGAHPSDGSRRDAADAEWQGRPDPATDGAGSWSRPPAGAAHRYRACLGTDLVRGARPGAGVGSGPFLRPRRRFDHRAPGCGERSHSRPQSSGPGDVPAPDDRRARRRSRPRGLGGAGGDHRDGGTRRGGPADADPVLVLRNGTGNLCSLQLHLGLRGGAGHRHRRSLERRGSRRPPP